MGTLLICHSYLAPPSVIELSAESFLALRAGIQSFGSHMDDPQNVRSKVFPM